MEKQTTSQLTYWAGVIIAGVFIGLLIQFARAWTEPSQAPPGGNVGAPINTGGNLQVKAGPMGINALGWTPGPTVNPLGLLVGGKAQADDFCLNNPTTKCLSNSGGGGVQDCQVVMSNTLAKCPAGYKLTGGGVDTNPFGGLVVASKPYKSSDYQPSGGFSANCIANGNLTKSCEGTSCDSWFVCITLFNSAIIDGRAFAVCCK